MKRWKFFMRSYFGFSQKETNGFIVLMGILISLLIFTMLFSAYYPDPKPTTEEDRKILAQLISEVKTSDKSKEAISTVSLTNSKTYFNPNTASESELSILLGKKLASTIINYRSKGGRFKTKEDLLKIYGMNTTLYESIFPWVKLDQVSHAEGKSLKSEKLFFNINKADTIELQRIKGIGKILALRIIKFRDKLGGFYDKKQYEEVYGLTPEVIKELNIHTFIDKEFKSLLGLSVNKSEYEILAAHPYIGKKFAYHIIKYRKSKGSILSLEELKSIKELTEQDYIKMLPYIKL